MHGRPRQPDGAAWLRCAALLLLCRAGECLLLGGALPARAAPRTSGVSGLVCAARPITNLADVETYEAKIAEAKAGNKLVVIKFFASWCRACKVSAPAPMRPHAGHAAPSRPPCLPGDGAKVPARGRGVAGHRVLRDHVRQQQEALQVARHQSPSVRPPLARVRASAPADLRARARSYIEIVAGSEGKVEGFTCGPSKFPRLQASTARRVRGACRSHARVRERRRGCRCTAGAARTFHARTSHTCLKTSEGAAAAASLCARPPVRGRLPYSLSSDSCTLLSSAHACRIHFY